MKEMFLTIIGTKGMKKEDASKFEIYTKEEVIERIKEQLEEGYGFSIVKATR